MNTTSFSIIVAMAEDYAIGRNNELLFHIPEDLKHFQKTTRNHAVIMGRKTYESIGRPLPHRLNLVLSRNPHYVSPPGVLCVKSLQEALQLVPAAVKRFVIGGGELYKEALPMAQELIVTRIKSTPTPPADTFFPPIDETHWQLQECSPWYTSKKEGLPYRFEYYAALKPTA